MDERVFKIQADGQQAMTSIKDIRQALKEVKDEMANVEAGSDAWVQLANKAGEYKHQIDEITQAVKGASSDFGDMLGNIGAIGAGVAGAFQTAKAAMSMFGIESQEVIESIKTMQNLMAMTQGLASIDAMNKALPKLAASIKSTSVAAKALKAALQPKTFMLITAAVTALSLAFNKLTANAKKASQAEKERYEAYKKTQLDKQEAAQKKYNEQLKKEVELKERLLEIKYAGDDVKVLTAVLKDYQTELDEVNGKLKDRYNDEEKFAKKRAYKDIEKQLSGLTEGTQEYMQALIDLASAEQDLNKVKPLSDEDVKKLTERQTELNGKIEEYKEKLKEAIAVRNALNALSNKQFKEEGKEYIHQVNLLNIQRSMHAGTSEEFNILKEIIKLYRGDIIPNLETLYKTKKDAYEIDKNSVEKLKEKLAAEEAIKTAEAQMYKTQRELEKAYINFFTNISSTIDLETQWAKLFDGTTLRCAVKDAFRQVDKVVIGELEKLKHILDDEAPDLSPGRYLGLSDEEKNKILENLQITEEALKKLIVAVGNRSVELAKLQREANLENVDALSATQAEYKDIEKEMKLLIDIYGTGITQTEEFMEMQKRANELLLAEKNIKDAIAETDIQIREEEAYSAEGEIQLLNEKIALEEERLEIIKDIYGADSLEFKQQQANLKSMKKSLEDVKYAAVQVATRGLGFIADMLTSVADAQDTQTREGFEKQKKLSIAATIMNGLAGAINAVTSWMSPANAWMTAPVQAIMGSLEAAAIGVATGFQVKQIAATKFDGNGNVNNAAMSGILLPPVEYTNAVQGAEIQETIETKKSYVAVTEIEEVGNRVNVAEAESKY